MPVSRPNLDSGRAPVAVLIGEDGEYAGPRAFMLATNGAITPSGKIRGGRWLWTCEATNWNGATATLKKQKLSGATFVGATAAGVTMTADGTQELTIGTGQVLTVEITGGTPTGFYSNLASA